MRRPALALVLLPLPCLLPCCQGQPTRQPPRSLAAPVHGAERLWNEFVSPAAIAEDAGDVCRRLAALAPEGKHWAGFEASFDAVVVRDVERVGALPAGAGDWLAHDRKAIGRIAGDAEELLLQSGGRFGDLQRNLHELPVMLQLDRAPLGEDDDVRHRTDPDDDHPEAGFVQRVLRRILP